MTKEEQLSALMQELTQCTACALHTACKGSCGCYGAAASPLVIVGEGPGAVEDDYGCPLIGPSGQLLDKALWAVGVTRDRILTTNVVKCRPERNRTPTLEEASFCGTRWLERELAICTPKVLVALGSVALHYFGGAELKITRDRGQWFRTSQGCDCIATYHPAYLLRLTGRELNRAKWDVFHDLEAARQRAAELAPHYNFAAAAPTQLFSIFAKR